MKRTISVFAAIGLLIAISVPVAAATPGQGVYVSLGDSLAAGSQADAEGTTTFSSDQAYTDELHQRLKGRLVADLSHVKLGCPGETALQLLGGVDKDGNPSNCADRYQTGSQIGDVLAAITQGNVVLITLDIGANDLFDAQETCGNDTACLGDQIAAIAGQTAQIIVTIREAGYAGPIVAMNFYNPLAAAAIGYFGGVAGQHAPDLQLALSSDALVSALNGAQGQVYAVLGVPVADVYDAFNAGDFGDDIPGNGRPDNVDVLCSLSYMCPRDPAVKSNIHLNKQGYTVVAKTFLELIVG
jgi:lysophospholipase L1-like esterase